MLDWQHGVVKIWVSGGNFILLFLYRMSRIRFEKTASTAGLEDSN
jgi:hypothetical protein